MKKHFRYLAIIALFVSVSCKKNETTTPPANKAEPTATAVGANDGSPVLYFAW